jgi:nitrate/TMAO reductase-like tetraheme cytochrome c subunit
VQIKLLPLDAVFSAIDGKITGNIGPVEVGNHKNVPHPISDVVLTFISENPTIWDSNCAEASLLFQEIATMSQKKKKSAKSPQKFILILKLFKRNFLSLHRLIWGRGWKRFGIAVVVTLVLITAFMIFTLEITSQPRFCNTCHNMKPYYSSWQESSHNHVTCTDCHFPPGLKNKVKGKFTALSMLVNYFTGIYKRSKPWAEIPDESCMRSGCHETRLLQGKATFKKKIIFDHEPHLEELRRGKKLRCTSCHSQIVQGSHISVTETTCFLCHFKGAETGEAVNACKICHKPPVAKDGDKSPLIYNHRMVVEHKIECQKCHGDMKVGDGNVPKARCHVCHDDMGKLNLYRDTPLMHKNHITDHKIECDQCHMGIQHKSVARTKYVKPDCHSCHPDFHNAQLYLFTGKGGRGVPEHPSHMYLAGLNCQACHIFYQPANGFKLKGEFLKAHGGSCEPCHEKGYDKLLEDWKATSERKLSRISNVLQTARDIVERNKTKKGYTAARKKLEDADYNYKLVKYGAAVHNIIFANRLMEQSYRLAKESLQDVDSTTELPYFEAVSRIVPGDCSKCHIGLEQKIKKVFGWRFSHLSHLKTQNLPCQHCHSHEEKHGKLIIGKQDCMSCHHKGLEEGKELECKTCHGTQQYIYTSELAFSTFKIPNVMVKDVVCLDCHQDEKKKLLRRPDKTICSNCHEKDYEDMFVKWQQASLELLNRLREKVKKEKLREGDRAYNLLVLLETDGSKGIHNPELYEKLIQEALK